MLWLMSEGLFTTEFEKTGEAKGKRKELERKLRIRERSCRNDRTEMVAHDCKYMRKT